MSGACVRLICVFVIVSCCLTGEGFFFASLVVGAYFLLNLVDRCVGLLSFSLCYWRKPRNIRANSNQCDFLIEYTCVVVLHRFMSCGVAPVFRCRASIFVTGVCVMSLQSRDQVACRIVILIRSCQRVLGMCCISYFLLYVHKYCDERMCVWQFQFHLGYGIQQCSVGAGHFMSSTTVEQFKV